MDTVTKFLEVLAGVLKMAEKYGVPAVVAMLDAVKKQTVTDEDIRDLATKIKSPDKY